MFARLKTQTNKDGSVRVDGRPRQRVVATLGRLDALAAGGLDRLVHSLVQFAPRLQVIVALSAIAADGSRALRPLPTDPPELAILATRRTN